MARSARLVLLLLLAAFYLPLSATTIPPDGKFPPGFWSDILSGRDSLRYGDSGWVKRMRDRREVRQQIAAGQTTLAALKQDQFTVPVLLGRYSDATTVYDSTDFNRLLFGDNETGSFVDYYDEISLGQFQVDGESNGWYTVSNQASYDDGTDTGDSDSFVYDVVAAADGEIDYSLYDNDGPDGKPNSGDDDGYVDGVIVVYSGVASYQVEDGDTPNLWPVSSNLNNEYVTDDMSANGGAIKVSAYAIGPEKYDAGFGEMEIHPIGVFAHEFGHILGMPDLYDYTGEGDLPDKDNSEGIGTWCLMASGSWGGDGQHAETPAHMSAWCKMLLGWVTPVTVEQEGQLTIRQAETNDDVYRLWADPNRMSSYYLVENRQQVGFDEFLEGSGLMIYHVDELRWWGEAAYASGYNNNDETHKLVDIEEADGRSDMDDNWNQGDDGDPWPGSSGNTEFNSFSTTSSLDYDGNATGVAIEQISSSGENMTAYFTPAAVQGYGISYDEQGISGRGWGYESQDIWSGVLFTVPESGTLEALDIGFRAAGNQYTITVYQSLEDGFFGGKTPSGALAVIDDYEDNPGWHTIPLSEPIELEAGQDFFVKMVIYGQSYSISYDSDGEDSGRSYWSSDGRTFDLWSNSFGGAGDINIRARIRTAAVPNAQPIPSVSIDTLAFGAVTPGGSSQKTLQLYNWGDATLNATLSTGGDISFAVSPSVATVAPGDSQAVTVTFSPATNGDYVGSLLIIAAETELEVALTGTGKTLQLFAGSIGDETFVETTGSYLLWVKLNPVLDDPTVVIVYSMDGETVGGQVECELVGDRYEGSVPAQPLNSSFFYYFAASDDGEEIYTLPANVPIDFYKITVALDKPGDLDGNWTVNIFDLLDMLSQLSQPDAGGQSDVDGNGKVDIFDLLELLKLMGRD